MAYGTATGISYIVNVKNYNDWLNLTAAGGGIDAAQVTSALADADGMIDAELAKLTAPANLPLASPPRVIVTTANYLAACILAKSVFIQQAQNSSEWVNGEGGICPTGKAMLEAIVKNPEVLSAITGMGNVNPDSTTLDDDAIFSVGVTQDDGATDISTGTMDKW